MHATFQYSRNFHSRVSSPMGGVTVVRNNSADSHATWPRGYKTFFMLNSTEHEILTSHKN